MYTELLKNTKRFSAAALRAGGGMATPVLCEKKGEKKVALQVK
jgi:hypothetical protein